MGLSEQEYWLELFLLQGASDPEAPDYVSCAGEVDASSPEPPGKPQNYFNSNYEIKSISTLMTEIHRRWKKPQITIQRLPLIKQKQVIKYAVYNRYIIHKNKYTKRPNHLSQNSANTYLYNYMNSCSERKHRHIE